MQSININTLSSLSSLGAVKTQRDNYAVQKSYNKNYEMRKAVRTYLKHLLKVSNTAPSKLTQVDLNRLETYKNDVYKRTAPNQPTPIEMVEDLNLFSMFTTKQLQDLSILSNRDSSQLLTSKMSNDDIYQYYENLKNVVRRKLFQRGVLHYTTFEEVDSIATDIICDCLIFLNTNDLRAIDSTIISRQVTRTIRGLQALQSAPTANDYDYSVTQFATATSTITSTVAERNALPEEYSITREQLDTINNELLANGLEPLENIVRYIVDCNNDKTRQQLIAGLQTFTAKYTSANVSLQNIHLIRRLLAGENM